MIYASEEKLLMSTRAKTNTATETAERRDSGRLQVTISAEVVEIKSGTRFSTRTTDLSAGGCFVDSLMPLPVGSSVHIFLRKDATTFEAAGTVTFSQAGLGMGIGFCDLTPDKLAALQAWLTELSGERPCSPAAPRPSTARFSQPSNATHALLIRLLRLLVFRGLISEAEASALFHETQP